MRTTIFILAALLLLSACDDDNRLCLKGRGDIVSETINLSSVDQIILDIPADIILKESNTQLIQISAQQNVIDEIIENSTVSQGLWRIKVNKSCVNADDIRIFVSIPTISLLKIDGSGAISSEGTFNNVADLDLEINGSGLIDLDLATTNDVLAILDGSGLIRLGSGSANNLTIDLDGSGNIEAFGFNVTNCDVSLDGSGSIELNVSDELLINIDGSGTVCYRGNPDLNFTVDGSGSVNDCN